MSDSTQRDWNAEWQKLDITINKGIWLLTERIKLQYLLPLIPKNGKLLEVGCGSAKLSVLLAQKGCRVVGIDRSIEALRLARANCTWLAVPGVFAVADAFQLPFLDGSFDVVFSTGLLEHFRNPVPVVMEMTRVLRNGGVFFSDVVPLKFSLIRLNFYLHGLYRQASDEYPYRSNDIYNWLRQSGLQNIRVFSSGVLPPLGLLGRLPLVATLSLRYPKFWTLLDGTFLSDWLGFFYLAFAVK